jgi:glycosyltransferase involved in cell wall biosynthesis
MGKASKVHEIVGLAENPCPITRRRSMRILSDIQLSNKKPNSGKFLFSKDSNVVIISTFINAIKKYRPDWSVSLLVPYPDQLVTDKGENFAKDAAIDQVKETLRDVNDWPNLHLLPYRYVPEAFTQRFNFSVNELRPHLRSLVHEYDMVYCQEPAQAHNWNMMMFGRRMGDIMPIISYYHWITGWTDRKGASENLDWIIRHGEGAFHSTLGFAASKTALSLLVEGFRSYFNRGFLESVIPKLANVVEPTNSSSLLEKKHMCKRTTEGPLRFLWAHRLNDYTGWKEAFNALKPLHEKYPGKFTLWVPDPGNREKQENLQKQWPFIEQLDKTTWDYDDYANLCWNAHVALGNHNRLSVWGGLALSEPQICGCFPLVPDTTWYREQVGPADEAGINFFKWKDKQAFTDAAEKLLNKPKEWIIKQGEHMSKYVHNLIGIDAYAERIIGYFESIAYPRREEKWVNYVYEAARKGLLKDDGGMTLPEFYKKMQHISKTHGLVGADGKQNSWPFVKKNLWPTIRRRLLDSQVLVDDPTHPDCLYKIGPGIEGDLAPSVEPEGNPAWRISKGPWLYRGEGVEDVQVGLKNTASGIIYPACSIPSMDAIKKKEPNKVDQAEFAQDPAELVSICAENKTEIPDVPLDS